MNLAGVDCMVCVCFSQAYLIDNSEVEGKMVMWYEEEPE